MKKKILYIVLTALLSFVLFVFYQIMNPVSPLETVIYDSDDKNISVSYSRPLKKGRLVFGNESDGALVPYDMYWRTGANRHTTIETNVDLKINNNILQPGKYSLFTIPGEEFWEDTFNTSNSYFGIMRPALEKDLFTVTVPSKSLEMVIEQLTIDFVSSTAEDNPTVDLRLRWDTTEIIIPLN